MKVAKPVKHCAADLIELFNALFMDAYNTCLVGGMSEPIYLPVNDECQYHQLCFRDDYFASALHEISHWCIAGEHRRLLEDFGYWYEPDGRTHKQQLAFLKVEVAPQAIESLFSMAAAFPFQVSFDNLGGEALVPAQDHRFKQAVEEQRLHYLTQGLPIRANMFYERLQQFYGLGVTHNA